MRPMKSSHFHFLFFWRCFFRQEWGNLCKNSSHSQTLCLLPHLWFAGCHEIKDIGQ